MTTDNEAVNAAAELLKEIQDEDTVEGVLTLSTGVHLKPKRFPLWALRDAQRKIKEPVVPFVFVEDKGREEPNPNDPGYLAEVDEYTNKLSDVALNIALMLGCEVIDFPPEMPRPEDDQWIEDLLFLEVLDEAEAQDIRVDSRRRNIVWMRYYAIADEKDIGAVMSGPLKKTLVAEEDVDASMRSFPNRKTRRAASRSKAQEDDSDGD